MDELIGVVLCGGKSSRMGTDKSTLDYHGMPQWKFTYYLLKLFCKVVYVSYDKNAKSTFSPGYNTVPDDEKYSGNGPMTALLSAFELEPKGSLLVIGNDYPFIMEEHVRQLVDARTTSHKAVCFRNATTRINEPLIAIYENSSYEIMLRNFKNHKFSLRHCLDDLNAHVIKPRNTDFLTSIDTPDAYRTAKKMLASKLN